MRSKISSPPNEGPTTNPSRVLQTPLQSLTVAVCASRSDVATSASRGWSSSTRAMQLLVRAVEVGMDSPYAADREPSAAEKSSSLPNSTSTCSTSDRFVSAAASGPPSAFQSDGR